MVCQPVGRPAFPARRLAEARVAYERALNFFPRYSLAIVGLARVKAASGELDEAASLARPELERAPSIGLAAFLGDLAATRQQSDEAERYYNLAEAVGRGGTSASDESFALFLAERHRSVAEAERLAEEAARTRHDIVTLDALAWARFRVGNIGGARTAIEDALRTGTRDRKLRYHAAAILQASGDVAAARDHLRLAIDGHRHFDLIAAPEALALEAALSKRASR